MADPGGPRLRARSPALAFVSPLQAERRPQPARDAFQKPRDYFAEGTCRPVQPPFSAPRRWAPQPRPPVIPPLPRGCPPALLRCRLQPSWGSRGGCLGPCPRSGSPAAALFRGPRPHPRLGLSRSTKAPGRRIL